MDGAAFITAVRETSRGERLMLKFNADANGLSALKWFLETYCMLDESGAAIVSDNEADDAAVAATVILNGSWGDTETARDANRSLRFIGLESLDDNALSRLARDIEKVG